MTAKASPRYQISFPIVAMTMMGGKMYIATTLDLIKRVKKLPKLPCLFSPEPSSQLRSASLVRRACIVLIKDVISDDGDRVLSVKVYASIRAALSAGLGLEGTSRVMIQTVAVSFNSLHS